LENYIHLIKEVGSTTRSSYLQRDLIWRNYKELQKRINVNLIFQKPRHQAGKHLLLGKLRELRCTLHNSGTTTPEGPVKQ
jgi:hypothetical protein